MRNFFLALTIGVFVTTGTSPVHAEQTYDRISLAASAGREVQNDLQIATLFSQHEGPDAAALADAVNREIRDAVEQARAVSGVKLQTSSYNTSPIYRDRQLTGWRVRQSLRLESGDATALSDLVGALQKRLRLESIQYAVSEDTQREVEDELITEALAAFQARAKLITGALERPGYRIVSLDIDTGGVRPPPMPYMRAMAAEAAPAPPVMEGGTQRIEVSVTGSIELRVD